MSTRSNSSHLFSLLRDPESLIRRRNLGEPSSLFNFEEVMNNNHNQELPPQNNPPPMVRPNGQAPRTMEELCQPLPGDDANRHIDKFLEITQHMKQNGVSNDALRLSLFPYYLTHHAIAWNEIMKYEQKPHESLFEAWEHYNLSIDRCPNHNMLLVTQIDTFYNGLTLSHRATIIAAAGEMMRQIQTVKAVDMKCETCGGPHSFTECPTIGGYTQETAYAAMGTGSLPSNTVPNPREDLKAITTRSGVTLAGPSVSPPPLSKVVNREPETITDQMPEVTKDTPKPTIPYPSRSNKQKLREKDDNLALKFVEILRNLHFELSYADALLHMPKFALMFKSLLNNKEKLFDLATTLVNDNCSAVILKKLLEKLGDPVKFLIPCGFPEFDECLTLADLGASINLMPLSIWKKLSVPELTSTQMILELADRSTNRPADIAEDVFVKVGKFHFPTDFVVVDYVVDSRVPLILGRPFLRTERSLIDVYGEELTLRVDGEAITFKVIQTLKYSYNGAESINQIDVIDLACEEYVQEVLGFSDKSKSGSPTPTSDPIISSSSPSFTPFEGSDFILEEIKTFLRTPDEFSNLDNDYYDTEGDNLYLEKLLNEDPSPNIPPIKIEDLKQVDANMTKPSIDEPPEIKLKELPSHLEYAFLEGTDKLSVIISKELKDEEKSTLLKILKSHKWAIAWKIFDIKGIDPYFFTHKILMEDDFKPTVQHQRRVSPVHCVPKKGGMTVVGNEDNELIPTRLVTGWRVCIDYRKLNDATRKYHFPLPFMDQMLEHLARNEFYCFLDGFSGYFHIPIDPQDQEKTTFTCPYRTFAYRRMPFGLCNAPGTFQRCMMAIFHDMIEKTMKVFMDDYLVFGDSFSSCLSHLDKMLQRCEDTNLVLNWEKCHFMVKEGIVLGHKISKSGIKVDRAKDDVIAKLSHPTSVKVLSKTMVYTDHSALKYLLAKQDAKPRLLRLENSHQDELERKEITETFPPETLGENRASWSDKLDDALWDFRTAFKTPIGCTPYKLVYEKACHLPIELEHKAY
uniref:Reverse transcriptase domain-containing protein n=1 Tax=Tanacetum cinerariifolium TaxID=118510 RepID=A0A6L2L4F3_TANCI|nr:reverse transcriptase domain-containing protein [Tanacetum cinerariifolium]